MPIAPDGGAARRGDDVDPGQALCARLVELLPISGASISVVTEIGSHSIVGASDGLAAELEARQFELGVGPHWDALRTEHPALLYKRGEAAAPTLWQQLEGDVVLGDAAALFAFPLQLDAATVGIADLYSRSTLEPWSGEMIRRGQDVALGVTASAVRIATRSAEAAASTTGRNAVELRREVHQAAGMVMAQLDCSASTALLRLRAQAFASDTPLVALAREVTTRRLDFADL